MVKIPDRPFAGMSSALPDPRLAGDGGAAMHATDALVRAGKEISDTVYKFHMQREHDLLTEGQNKFVQMQNDYSLQAERERTGGAAAGHTQDHADVTDGHTASLEDWLKNRGAGGQTRRACRYWADERKNIGNAHAARFEHAQLSAHSRDLFAQRLQGITDSIEQNPRSFNDAQKELEAAFVMASEAGQGHLRPEEAKAMFHDAREKLGSAAFENHYAMQRKEAMGAMDAYLMSPAQQAKAWKRYWADTRADAAHARGIAAQAAENLRFEYQDAVVWAKDTGDTKPIQEVAAKYDKLGLAKQGEHALIEARRLDARYGDILKWREMPLPALGEEAKRLAGELSLAGGARDGKEDIPALVAKKDKLGLMLHQYQTRAQAYSKDPAGAADPFAAGDSPQDRTASRLRVQAANGVPAFAQRLLTKSEAAGLSQDWRNGGAGERLALFSAIQKNYGRNAARVIGETGMKPLEEGLARTALAAGNSEAAQNFIRLSAASGAADKDLPQADEENTKKIAREIGAESERLAAMRDLGQKVMPGNTEYFAGLARAQGEVERLLRLNNNNKEEVIRILDAGVGRLRGNGFALLYEKSLISGGRLETALQRAKSDKLDAFDEALPGYALDKPPKERKRWLARNGIWGNAPDGEGFVLYDPQSQAPILDKHGQYLRVNYRDAAELGETPLYDAGGI
jgi:hypothetical protein